MLRETRKIFHPCSNHHYIYLISHYKKRIIHFKKRIESNTKYIQIHADELKNLIGRYTFLQSLFHSSAVLSSKAFATNLMQDHDTVTLSMDSQVCADLIC